MPTTPPPSPTSTADRISEGFLVTLGPPLPDSPVPAHRPCHRARSCSWPTPVTAVVGFVAATTSTRHLYADFLRHDALPAGLAAAPGGAAGAPPGAGRPCATARGDHDLPAAEVLSIAVAADAGGQGTGGTLLAAALAALADTVSTEAQVVTAVGQPAAIAMYERAGFRRRGRTEVHAGVAQEVLVWP